MASSSSSSSSNNCTPVVCGNVNINTLGSQGVAGSLPAELPASAIDVAPGNCAPATAITLDLWLAWAEAILCLFDTAAIQAATAPAVIYWDGTSVTAYTMNTLPLLRETAANNDIVWYDAATGDFTQGTFAQYLESVFGTCTTAGQVIGCDGTNWGVSTLAIEDLSNVTGVGANGSILQNVGGNSYQPVTAAAFIAAALGSCSPGQFLTCVGGNYVFAAPNFVDLGDTDNTLGADGSLYYNNNGTITPISFNDYLTLVYGACTAGQVLGCGGWIDQATGGATAWTGLSDTSNTVGNTSQIIQNVAGTLSPVDPIDAISASVGAPTATTQVLTPAGWADAATGTTWVGLTDTAATLGNDCDIISNNGGVLTPSTFTDYLDRCYPATSTNNTCPPRVFGQNAAGVWGTIQGMPERPETWAFPLAPQSVPLQLSTSENAGNCPEWVCPDRVVGNFSVPGDFPTVPDFVAWADGKSLDVTLNVTADQVDWDTGGLVGNLSVIGNGAINLGGITHQNPSLGLTLGSAELDSMVVSAANVILSDISQINTTTTVGLAVQNGANAFVSGDLIVAGASTTGLLIDSGANVTVTGSTGVEGAHTAANIRMIDGALTARGPLVVRNSGGSGILAQGSTITALNQVLANLNTEWGIELASSTFLQRNDFANGYVLQANGNGTGGIEGNNGSSVTSDAEDVQVNGNTIGLQLENASSMLAANITTGFNSNNNTNNGVVLNGASSATIAGGPISINNNATGIFVNGNSIGFLPNAAINNSTFGVFASNGGQANVTGATFAGNTNNGNIAFNTLGPAGQYIAN